MPNMVPVRKKWLKRKEAESGRHLVEARLIGNYYARNDWTLIIATIKYTLPHLDLSEIRFKTFAHNTSEDLII